MGNSLEQGYKSGEKSARTGILVNLVLALIKLYAGVTGRSQAMIADAIHTASDVFSGLAVFVGFRIASKPADEHHPFGHGRAESIAAKVVSLILIYIGLQIAFSSVKVLLSGELSTPSVMVLWVAVLSIAVKEMLYRYMRNAGQKINSTCLKTEAKHHKSDSLSSVAALIGIAGARMGKPFMDPLAGILVSGFIIKYGFESFHAAYDELMDAAPPKEFTEQIGMIIGRVDGVEEVKKIMIRKTGIEYFIEAIIGVEANLSVKSGHDITVRIKRDIYSAISNVKDVIVHVEPCHGMITGDRGYEG